MSRIISQAELKRNTTSKSCFVTIGNKVYDVTEFLDAHPGGSNLILDYAGKDVEEIMKDEESNVHSDGAYEELEGYLIGTLSSEPNGHAVNGSASKASGLETVTMNGTANGTMNGNANGAPNGHSIMRVPTKNDRIGNQASESFVKILTNSKRKTFLDLDKPMVQQIWNSGFSKEYYLEQVHKPTIYRKGPSAPMFGNFLEPLTMTPWWLIPLIWYPSLACGVYKANSGLSSPTETGLYFLLGLSLWTLIEYGMHRGLFHVDKYLPDNRVGLTAHFLLHGVHHYLPTDPYRLVMPPVLLLFLATPFYRLAHTVFYWDWYIATAVFCGGFFGYIGYDLTHYFLHHKDLPSFYQPLKKYHTYHHWKDHEAGFGVTSRFWDKVFGTELDTKGRAAKAA